VKKTKRRTVNLLAIRQDMSNVKLIKDVGMIPYYFHKLYNFDSTILTYKNDKYYPYLEKHCKGMKLKFLKKRKRFNKISFVEIPIVEYLIRNAKKIDILQLTWLSNPSIIYGLLYQLLNKNGILYIKMDADERIINHSKIKPNGFRGYQYYKKGRLSDYVKNSIRIIIGKLISKLFFKRLNLLVIECIEYYNALKNYPKITNKLIYLPNGIDDGLIKNLELNRLDYNDKENIILTVGEIGAWRKNNEILLEAVAKVNDLKNWKVLLIGPIKAEFKKYIKEYFEKYPLLRKKVIFTGKIIDRKKLFEYFQKSKIFCLTSIWEGFPLVFSEAGYFGNYIISSDLPPAIDISNNGKFGKIFKRGNSNELAQILETLIENENIIENNYLQIQKYVEEKLLWRILVPYLYKELVKRTNR